MRSSWYPAHMDSSATRANTSVIVYSMTIRNAPRRTSPESGLTCVVCPSAFKARIFSLIDGPHSQGRFSMVHRQTRQGAHQPVATVAPRLRLAGRDCRTTGLRRNDPVAQLQVHAGDQALRHGVHRDTGSGSLSAHVEEPQPWAHRRSNSVWLRRASQVGRSGRSPSLPFGANAVATFSGGGPLDQEMVRQPGCSSSWMSLVTFRATAPWSNRYSKTCPTRASMGVDGGPAHAWIADTVPFVRSVGRVSSCPAP